jgi:hypothetical protein
MEHVLIGKPASTFPGHAHPAQVSRTAALSESENRGKVAYNCAARRQLHKTAIGAWQRNGLGANIEKNRLSKSSGMEILKGVPAQR